jgi:hypothetical protein
MSDDNKNVNRFFIILIVVVMTIVLIRWHDLKREQTTTAISPPVPQSTQK